MMLTCSLYQQQSHLLLPAQHLTHDQSIPFILIFMAAVWDNISSIILFITFIIFLHYVHTPPVLSLVCIIIYADSAFSRWARLWWCNVGGSVSFDVVTYFFSYKVKNNLGGRGERLPPGENFLVWGRGGHVPPGENFPWWGWLYIPPGECGV